MHSLRRRTLLLVAAVLACCVIAGYYFSQRVTDSSFRQFESSNALQSLERAGVLLAEQISGLTKQTRDYAVWTATYDYMASHDPAYVQENYLLDGVNNLDVDFVALLGTDRQVVVALATPTALGRRGNALLPWFGPLRDRLLADPKIPALLVGADSGATLGFIDGTSYLIGVSSILDSNAKGPTRGTLVFVRRLSPARMARLRGLTQAEFQVRPPDSRQSQGAARVEGALMSATLPLYDGQHRQLAQLTVTGPRVLAAQNLRLRQLSLFNILGLSLIALSLAYLLFDRLVLRKVSTLVTDISRARQHPESQLRLPAQDDDDLDKISTEVNRLLDEVQRSQSLLRHDALHDSLTGLGNRQLLLDSLALAQARLGAGMLTRFALLLLDLDGFKEINDLHGHLAGDQVLKAIALRLSTAMRDDDLALRLGGDEFLVLIQSSGGSDADGLARRLLGRIAEPLECEGHELQVHASIGILQVDATHANVDPEELLHRVDLAMYAAKRAGRNGYRHFDEVMQQDLRERRLLLEDLKVALDQDALEVWYQPVFTATQHALASIEALSRWPHPQRGMVPPAVFVPLAEEINALPKLDCSVLKKSCRVLKTLRSEKPGLTLSVNVSVLTLMLPNITEFITGLLRDNDLPGSALCLEVTETALARSVHDLREPMAALHAEGVRFQIDDFGTGYSSLPRLNLLPLDTVKIDGSFVATLDDGDEKMCQAIIHLVHHLKMRVTAEGVETPAQRDTLVRLGCDEMQGYLFSRPVTAEQLLAHWIDTSPAVRS